MDGRAAHQCYPTVSLLATTAAENERHAATFLVASRFSPPGNFQLLVCRHRVLTTVNWNMGPVIVRRISALRFVYSPSCPPFHAARRHTPFGGTSFLLQEGRHGPGVAFSTPTSSAASGSHSSSSTSVPSTRAVAEDWRRCRLRLRHGQMVLAVLFRARSSLTGRISCRGNCHLGIKLLCHAAHRSRLVMKTVITHRSESFLPNGLAQHGRTGIERHSMFFRVSIRRTLLQYRVVTAQFEIIRHRHHLQIQHSGRLMGYVQLPMISCRPVISRSLAENIPPVPRYDGTAYSSPGKYARVTLVTWDVREPD